MSMTLRINRTGLFTTKAQDLNQCKDTGHNVYYYHMWVDCDPDLDEKGFLIEHADLAGVMEVFGLLDSIGSCEQIVQRALNATKKLLDERNVSWLTIHLTLKPDPNSPAWMEGTLER